MEEEDVNPEYRKGFNEGYIIAKHLPGIAEQLSRATGENLRKSGFQDGYKQFLSERIKDRYPSWLKDDVSSKDRDEPAKSKDKDIEPEL